jgi:sugar/nucleoside kinase (ribokinase family)
MELYSRDRAAFGPEQTDLCLALARYAGLGIERSDAYARERKLAVRLAAVAEAAVEAARDCLPGCRLVKANAAEGRLLTGQRDPASAAEAIAAMGVELVVITLGPDGALARGAQAHAVPGRAARVVSTIGAGDAFFGALLARLQAAGWDAGALALDEALTAAAEAGARATETWGAVA